MGKFTGSSKVPGHETTWWHLGQCPCMLLFFHWLVQELLPSMTQSALHYQDGQIFYLMVSGYLGPLHGHLTDSMTAIEKPCCHFGHGCQKGPKRNHAHTKSKYSLKNTNGSKCLPCTDMYHPHKHLWHSSPQDTTHPEVRTKRNYRIKCLNKTNMTTSEFPLATPDLFSLISKSRTTKECSPQPYN